MCISGFPRGKLSSIHMDKMVFKESYSKIQRNPLINCQSEQIFFHSSHLPSLIHDLTFYFNNFSLYGTSMLLSILSGSLLRQIFSSLGSGSFSAFMYALHDYRLDLPACLSSLIRKTFVKGIMGTWHELVCILFPPFCPLRVWQGRYVGELHLRTECSSHTRVHTLIPH